MDKDVKEMTSNEKMVTIKRLILRKKGWGLGEEDCILLIDFINNLYHLKEIIK